MILLNRSSYVPRLSSALFVVGLLGMTVALLWLGAPLGAVATTLGAIAWTTVLIFRGRK